MCLIVPTAKIRNIPACHITLPNDSDCGIPPQQIPIAIVHNGVDHYVGTNPTKPTFKDVIDDIIDRLKKSLAIANDLILATDDNVLKQLFNFFIGSNKENIYIYSMARLFDFSGKTLDLQPKNQEKTRKGVNQFKPNQCPCGVIKESPEHLISHIQRKHGENNWYCTAEGCNSTCKSKK